MSDVDTNDVLHLAAIIRTLPHGDYRVGAAAEAEAILASDWGRPHARLVLENAALRERVEALEAAARQALEHVEELEEAWRRGALDESDGRGGTRSNRNVDVRMARAALAATPHEPQRDRTVARPLHLAWRNGGWVDDRCTSDPPCRFHPDDDNGSHGGRMHVHECAETHEPQEPT